MGKRYRLEAAVNFGLSIETYGVRAYIDPSGLFESDPVMQIEPRP